MTKPLDQLIDCAGIQRELGVKRAVAEAVMRHCPKVHVEGVRRVFVRRRDVARYLNERTAA